MSKYYALLDAFWSPHLCGSNKPRITQNGPEFMNQSWKIYVKTVNVVGGRLKGWNVGCSQTRFKALICAFLTSPQSHYSELKWLSYIQIFIKAWIDDTTIPWQGHGLKWRTFISRSWWSGNECVSSFLAFCCGSVWLALNNGNHW